MDGVETVDELRATGMTRSSIDLLPRIDGLLGLRQTKELNGNCLTRIHAALAAAPAQAILSGWAEASLGALSCRGSGQLSRLCGDQWHEDRRRPHAMGEVSRKGACRDRHVSAPWTHQSA